MVLASRLQRHVARVSAGSVRSAAPRARSAGSAAGRRGLSSSSGPPAATPGFTGTASSKAGRPLLSDNDAVFAWRNVLAANQKAYNAAHYPSTPLPATYRTLTKVSNVLIDTVWAFAFVAMGAAMSTGIWAPFVINAQRRAAEKRFAPLKGEIN